MASRSLRLTTFALLYLVPLLCAQRPGFEPADFQIGRTFWWSSDAPLRKALASFPHLVNTTNLILRHFDRVESSLLSLLSTGRAPPPNHPIQPCNHNNDRFAIGASRFFGARGWPDPDGSCVTDIYDTALTPGEVPLYTTDTLYEALLARGISISQNINPIIKSVISNFTTPGALFNFTYITASQRCVVHPAAGIRVRDNWYLSSQIINVSRDAQVPLRARQSVSEYVRVRDGRLDENMLMRLPERIGPKESPKVRTDATTIIATGRANRSPSFFRKLFVDENPAILESIDKSALFVQQAEDALTPSNIAILFLPLMLNLVPIALLANVSTITMLMYTIMSDLLTVIPLAIKGGELFIIGTQRHRTIVVRMTTASNGSKPEAAAAEIYAAECRAKDSIRPTGAAFLAISLVFLVVGVAAEIWAMCYSRKRRQRRRKRELETSDTWSVTNSSNASSVVYLECESLGDIGTPFDVEPYELSSGYGHQQTKQKLWRST